MKIFIIACIFLATVFAEETDKCVAGYDSCVKANGVDVLSRLNCGVGYLKCRFNSLVSEGDDLMFDDADSTSCSSELKTCVQTDGSDKKECMKKFKECVSAKITDKKEEAKKKYECVKKCKDEGLKCLKSSASKKECFVKATKCTKACFSKDDDDKLLFVDASDEEGEEEEGKDDKCVAIYKKCVAKLGKGFINRMKCGKKYLACRKAQGSEKVACIKKCKVAGFECLKNNGTKKECFMKATKCVKACFSKKEADDELLMGDEPIEESNDKCVAGYDSCVKANGADALSRFKCGMGYLKCRYSSLVSEDDDVMYDDADSTSCSSELKTCVQTDGSDKKECMKKFKECVSAKITDKKEEAKKKYECIKKCKAAASACIKKGKSVSDKKECVKTGYACAKKCFA